MNVLIIRPGALGDTLMLLPAIARLRASTKITLVGRFPGLYFLDPYVQTCIDYEGQGWHNLFLERPEHDALPVPGVEKVVAFLSDPEGRVKNNLKNCLPPNSVFIFPPFPLKDKETHVAFYLAQCLQMAGLPVDVRRSFKDACSRPLIEKKVSSAQREGIVLHPGSGGEKKNHAPSFWLGVIRGLRKIFLNKTEKFILLLGPAEEHLYSFYRGQLGDEGLALIFTPEKEELLSILGEAALYIGHDSGITHLTAMLGTPTIALFKNSSVQQWRPLGPEVRVIEDDKDPRRSLRKDLMSSTLLQCKLLSALGSNPIDR